MTTIVVDKRTKTIVSDNHATTNEGDISIPTKKLYRIEKGKYKGDIVGCTGHEGPFFYFLDHYRRGVLPEEPLSIDEHEGFEAVILTHDNRIMVADRYMRPYELEVDFYASGSGGTFAYGAMVWGASAESALRVACECDPSTSLVGRAMQKETVG